MSDKPSLIWHSNAPFVSTGYGQQTALFIQRLVEHYAVSVSAFYGLEGAIIPWNGIPVLPGIAQTHGNEAIQDHAPMIFGKDLRSGTILTLMDVWVLDPYVWRDYNVLSWVPVDHEPVPGPVKRFFDNSGAIPMAMSEFGREQLADLDPLYCPHGVDTKVYRPIDQAEARESVGLPEDVFIVGVVAANKGNPSRKCFSEAFQAFKVFHERHPESRLYIHTEATGRFQGVPLVGLMESVGLDSGAVIFCDQYRAVHFPFEPEVMANLYSSFDVLLAASAGEGFGIPTIEAQACGVPVIVSEFSAQPELVGAGWLVSGTKTYTPIGSWQFRPDVEDMIEALEAARRNAASPEIARKARAHAEKYDVDRVFTDFMLPAIKKAEQRFEARRPATLKAAA